MSGNLKKTWGGKRKGSGRKPKPRIIPHAIMHKGKPDTYPGENAKQFTAALRANNGLAIKELGSLLNAAPPAKFERIESVTELTWKDGSIPFLEVRIKTTTPPPNVVGMRKDKEYRHIFMGDLIWPPGPETGEERTARSEWCCTSGALMDAGLFIPSNSAAALEHLRRYCAELEEYNRALAAWHASGANEPFPEQPPPQPVFIWCEGEKSRLGVEAYLNDEEVMEYLESANVEITCLGVLAGQPGAERTNYVVKPSNPEFVVNGANDEALRLELPLHIYARDNDFDGIRESQTTCERLIASGAIAEQVKIAEPPRGVPEHWDDGDGLPAGMRAA